MVAKDPGICQGRQALKSLVSLETDSELPGRRQFFRRFGQTLLAAGAAFHFAPALGQPKVSLKSDPHLNVSCPGRLGNPGMTMLDDKRLDPRVRKAMSGMPAGDLAAMLPQVTLSSSYEECLQWVAAMEELLNVQNSAMLAAMPDFRDVVTEKKTIIGEDGNEIDLYIEKPKGADGILPCVVHIHGGGMAFTTTQAAGATRWRKTLARQGLVVVAVEFRNSGGVLGNHPFPAGLNDCAAAIQWVNKKRSVLNISSLVVAGESGGGNLAVATAVKANIEGWVDAIDGVYAMAPMILGFYTSVPSELLSWRENEGYQGTREVMRAMTRVYDPEDEHENNPMAWPFHASRDVLQGLPPHIIINYEMDLIRDDGAVFARNLQAAGVAAISRTVTGAPHVAEIAMPDLMPELVDDTIGSIVGFTKKLTRS
jgi:acetyl esterase